MKHLIYHWDWVRLSWETQDFLFCVAGLSWGSQGLTLCLPHVLALILKCLWQKKKSGQYDMTCSKCACAAWQWTLSPCLGTQCSTPTGTGYTFLGADNGLENSSFPRLWKYEWHLPVFRLTAATRLAWFLKDQQTTDGQSPFQVFLNALARHLSGPRSKGQT